MVHQEKLTENDIRTIFSEFSIGKIKTIKPLETSGNITFVIETTEKKLVLRLSPFGFRYRSKNEIRGELELLEHLTKHTIPSLKPLSTKNGETLVSWKKHYGYLREYNKGKEKSKTTFQNIETFGEWLGKFHSVVEGFKTKHARTHKWDVETTKKNFAFDRELILKSNFPNKKLFLKKLSTKLSKISLPKSMPKGTIHEDLGRRHVLWEKDTIVGVIDFDRAYYGELILDIGQASRGWCFSERDSKWNTPRFAALIAGYEKYRKITEQEKKYLVDAILFGILERSLSFALRFTNSKEVSDTEYAWFSLNTLVKEIEKNRKAIESILNTKSSNVTKRH